MASAKRFGAFSYVGRNVKRRSLRSAITVTGISVVIAFFILFASISQGLKDDIMEEIERQKEALLEQRAGFITLMILDPFSSNLFNGSELEQTDQYVKDYCAEHNTTGEAYPLAVNFLKSEEPDSDDMFLLFGIDPEKGVKYDFITFNNETVSLEGAYLSPTGGAEILLGNNVLQSNYPGVGVGDKIDIETVSYIAGASAILDNVTVTGILAPSIIYDNFAAMPIEYLLENTGLYDNATNEYFYMFISIWVEDASLIDFAELKAGIKDIAGLTDRDISDNENYIKRTILAHETEIAEQEEMRRTVDGWLLAVIVLLSIITVVGISNTMLMSVTERRREIGTLKAVGISKARIYQLVLGEAFVLVLISLIIGGITGVALAEYFDSQYDAEAGGIFFAPTNLTPFVLTYVVCISIGVAMLAALYPAWQAARLEPTEALRYE
ncbi:MAG: FtsX-like permease family protein [Thermoplasmata archaeon]|nr:FtsX-like permease family protein [Thermoplasmata archaeon]